MSQKLGLSGAKTTRMCIQLADKTVRYHREVVEDVLVKIKNFVFPMDFVVLDIEEDVEFAIILGHPF